MADLLAAILYGIFELFAEVILELPFEAFGSLFVRTARSVLEGVDSESPVLSAVG